MKQKLLLTALLVIAVSINLKAQDVNLFTNYQFDNGTTGWQLGNWGGEALMNVDNFAILSGDNSVFFDVVNTGTNFWDIQFIHANTAAVENEFYYFSFMAYCEEEFQLKFAWEHATEYTKYWQDTIVLATGKNHYKFEIECAGTDEAANFKLFLAIPDNLDKQVFIDSIVLSVDPFLYGEPVGMKEITTGMTGLEIFPNPANEFFTVEYGADRDQVISLDLYNLSGQKIRTLKENLPVSYSLRERFSTDGLEAGTYILRMKTGEKELNKILLLR